jgi:hypothetical protein
MLVLLILVFFTVSCQSEPKVNIKEGQWKITTDVKMKGMPMQMPPFTHTQCITKDDLVPKTSPPDQQEQNVEISNLKVDGNTVSYDITSSSPGGKMTGHSTITYEGDKMKGTMSSKIQPGNMEMTYNMSGKRIGDCPK